MTTDPGRTKGATAVGEDLPTIERLAEEHALTLMTGAERRLAEKGASDVSEPLRFLYRNHKGEAAWRSVTPLRLRFGEQPPWHPAPGWLLDAYDRDRRAERTFALCDVLAFSDAPGGMAAAAAALLRGLLARLDARPQTAPFVRASAERICADVEELARLVAALSPPAETR